MRFAAKEDLEIPCEQVFAMLSDFNWFERRAMQYGAEVTCLGDAGTPKPGLSWQVRAFHKGKKRKLMIELTEYDAPTDMVYALSSDGMSGVVQVEMVALSRQRTRLRVIMDIKPRTLAARLIVQSARLARKPLNRRFKSRFAAFTKGLERRYRQG